MWKQNQINTINMHNRILVASSFQNWLFVTNSWGRIVHACIQLVFIFSFLHQNEVVKWNGTNNQQDNKKKKIQLQRNELPEMNLTEHVAHVCYGKRQFSFKCAFMGFLWKCHLHFLSTLHRKIFIIFTIYAFLFFISFFWGVRLSIPS